MIYTLNSPRSTQLRHKGKVYQLFLALMFLMTITGVQALDTSALASKIIGYWAFNDTTNLKDYATSDSYNYDMTGGGTIVYSQTGSSCVVGNCVNVSAGYFATGASPHFPFTNQFAFCGWVKPVVKDKLMYFFDKWTTDTTNAGWLLNIFVAYNSYSYQNGTQVLFQTADGRKETQVFNNTLLSGLNWKFLCWTYDGVTARSWYNGTYQIGSVAATGNLVNHSAVMGIGRAAFGDAYGYFDDSYLFASNLSTEEMKFLYEAATNTTQCFYPFTDCGGTTPPVANDTATVTLATNIINLGNYTNNPFLVYFNGTVDKTTATGFNCSVTSDIESSQTALTYTLGGVASREGNGEGSGRKIASKFTATRSGYLDGFFIRIYSNDFMNTHSMQAFMYTVNSSGLPGTLIFNISRNELKFLTHNDFNVYFGLNETNSRLNPYIQNGTEYFIGIHLNNSNTRPYYNDNILNSNIQASDWFEDGLNESWDAPTTYERSLLIYAKTFSNGVRNATITDNQLFTFDTTGLEEQHYFNITCQNVNATNNIYRSIFIDTVTPTINLMSMTNNTVLYRYLTNTINSTVRATDLNLYAVNVTLYKLNPDNSRNASFDKFFTQNMTGSSKLAFYYNYTNSYLNNASWTNGKYEIEMMAWDSHTATEIKPYSIKNIQDGKQFKDVAITSKDITDFKYEKKLDRYSFDMEFAKTNPTIDVSCNGIEIIKDSSFKGHIVCWESKTWVDFEDGSDSSVTISKKDSKTVSVLIDTKGKTKLTFNSIGDLNYAVKSYYFNITDGYTFFARDYFTNVSMYNFTITVFNGGGVVQEKTATNSTNVTFNITSGVYNVNASAADYVTANIINLTFESNRTATFNMTAANSLYITVYDELNNTLINDRNVTITIINYDNQSYSYVINNGFTFISGFSAGSYEIRSSATNYPQRSYYATVTGSDTQQIKLYLLTDDATYKGEYTNFVIEDETGNLIEGATLKAYRHFIDCNCFRIVEMDLSNFNGVATLFLQRYDGKYRFIVENNGVTVYTSTAEEGYRLTEDAYTLKATTYGDTYQSYFAIDDVFTNLSYSNATKRFYYTVNDPTYLINRVCLYVDQINPLAYNGTTSICSSCTDTNSVTLTCDVSAYLSNNREIIAKGYVHTNTTYSSYFTDVISWIEDKAPVETLGAFGLFIGLLLSLTASFAGLTLVGISGGVIGFLLGVGVSIATGLVTMGSPIFIGVIALGLAVLLIVGGDRQ